MRPLMRPLITLVVLSLAGFLCVPAHGQPALPNGGFESGEPGTVPDGWHSMLPPERTGFVAELIGEGAQEGASCARVRFDRARLGGEEPQAPWGDLSTHLAAEPFRGKTVEYRAWVRCKPPEGGGPSRAQLWFRVDSAGGDISSFDNMGDRPVTSTQWREYTIAGEVAPDAKSIHVGVLCFGEGEVFIDAASLRITGDIPPALLAQPPAPLSDRGLANLTAFIRLMAYIRFFHPSDEAAAVDWEQFAVRGIRAVEDAPDAPALAGRLRELFASIAPTAVIVAEGEEASAVETNPAGISPAGMIGWVHEGVALAEGMGAGGGRYTSERVSVALDATGPIQPAGTVVDIRLPGGVRCIVPVTLFTDADGRTLPVSDAAGGDDGGELRLVPRDRSTRLAAIAASWAPLHHFYPYWEVVETDWDAALAEALRKGAVDRNEGEFLATLRAMIAKLHDGHGSAGGPGDRAWFFLPVSLAWVGERLVVTKVLPEAGETDVRRGDVIVSIAGRPAADVRAEKEALISGSPQWRAFRSARDVARFAATEPVAMAVQRPDGTQYEAALAPVRLRDTEALEEERPRNGDEIAPGVVYFNLHGTKDSELMPLIDKLAAAKGIVFDMRGYPNTAGRTVLRHLSGWPLKSADWEVRITTLPDGDPKGIAWESGTWSLDPAEPRLTGRVAFITDGGAISYAESCMAIVEHYKLGEIVGSPTAGANGNVNQIPLPGGYGVRYTGMKVRKLDGSQHHIIGVTPTVPVERTVEGIAAGRDELLEKAVEVVSRP